MPAGLSHYGPRAVNAYRLLNTANRMWLYARWMTAFTSASSQTSSGSANSNSVAASGGTANRLSISRMDKAVVLTTPLDARASSNAHFEQYYITPLVHAT